MLNTYLRRSFLWAAITALFLDQFTKILVYGMFHGNTVRESMPLLGNVLKISLTTNTRGVFGISFGPPFVHFILQGIGVVLVIYFGLRTNSRLLGSAYGIILGGALGNLIDRIRLGYVLDFIDFEIRSLHFRWFTFNLADAFIVVGVLLIILWEIISGIKSQKVKGSASEAPSKNSQFSTVSGTSKEETNEKICVSGQ